MEKFWDDLTAKADKECLSKEEEKLFTKLVKTLDFISLNPKHPGLHSHDIDPLSKRYGTTVWQSYLENRKPAAGRIFWVYGPQRGHITIIGLEPHPEDRKSRGYDRVMLSSLPPIVNLPQNPHSSRIRKKRR